MIPAPCNSMQPASRAGARYPGVMTGVSLIFAAVRAQRWCEAERVSRWAILLHAEKRWVLTFCLPCCAVLLFAVLYLLFFILFYRSLVLFFFLFLLFSSFLCVSSVFWVFYFIDFMNSGFSCVLYPPMPWTPALDVYHNFLPLEDYIYPRFS